MWDDLAVMGADYCSELCHTKVRWQHSGGVSYVSGVTFDSYRVSSNSINFNFFPLICDFCWWNDTVMHVCVCTCARVCVVLCASVLVCVCVSAIAGDVRLVHLASTFFTPFGDRLGLNDVTSSQLWLTSCGDTKLGWALALSMRRTRSPRLVF